MLRKIRVLLDSVNNCLFSYLVSMGRVVGYHSVLDSKQEHSDTEDDEHIYAQVDKNWLRVHMDPGQNNPPRFDHYKYPY